MTTIGLVRLTIAAPQRRIDIALPEHAAVAEYTSALLAHAGEDAVDEGAQAGGWALRRSDGRNIDLGQSLAAQQILDGDVLHLVPAGDQWPETEYDDLVDVVAGGARRRGLAWGATSTRAAGTAAVLTALLLGLVLVLRAGPSWSSAVTYCGVVAVLLLLGGVALARAAGDASLGAALGAAAVAHAAVAGALLPDAFRPLDQFGAPQLLGAGALAVLAALAGYFGIVERAAVFVAAAGAGLWAMLGGWLATTWLGAIGAAAIVTTAAVILLPALAPFAMRAGRLPRPVLPRSAADLLADPPQPARAEVYAAVLRSDALLTGLLIASALAVSAGGVLLPAGPGPSPRLLAGGAVLAVLLRARLLPVVRHRAPLLVAGVIGAVEMVLRGWHADPVTVMAPAALIVAAVLVAATTWYTAHRPGVFLGRYAEVAELLVCLSLIPLTCSVLGLYGRLHGMGG